MEAKSKRLQFIRETIADYIINSQDDLLKLLTANGFNLTQATLSRDLKLLKVAKIPDSNGIYKYVLPESLKNATHKDKQEILSTNGFISLEFSGNMGVITTAPSFAPTIAYAIDSVEFFEILGTISGNDTVFIVIREGFTPNDIIKAIKMKLPELKEKI